MHPHFQPTPTLYSHLHTRCAGRLHVKRVTLFLSDLASVTFRAPSSGQVGGPVPPSSGTTAATIGSTSGSADSNSSAPSSAPASLGGLHAMLGLPPPFCGVGGVRAEGSWRLRLPHLGKMPRVTAAAGSTTGSTGSKGGSISGSALVSEHSPVSFVVENPGLALRGAVMEFAVKLGPGLTPADVTLTVDDEVGTWRDGRGMARWGRGRPWLRCILDLGSQASAEAYGPLI